MSNIEASFMTGNRSESIRKTAHKRLSMIPFKSEISDLLTEDSTNINQNTTGGSFAGILDNTTTTQLDDGDSLFEGGILTEPNLIDSRTDFSCAFDDVSRELTQSKIPPRKILSVLTDTDYFPNKKPRDDVTNDEELTANDLRKLPKVITERIVVNRKDMDNDNMKEGCVVDSGVKESNGNEDEIVLVKERHIWETLDEKQRATLFQ